jgi:type I restriction enzyme S subunit
MSSENKIYTLEEITTLITDGKHGDCQDLAGSGYYFLSVKDVKGDRLNYEQARQITQNDFEETHRRTNLEPGDILFTNTGTIGRMAIASASELTRRTTFQKSVAILKPKTNLVISRYLFYLLKAENGRLSALAEGTTQKNLLLKDFRSFEIGELPPVKDQKAIAHILGTLDEKIELNRKTNETLESMAKALFKSWFVDLDPVRAKTEGRPTGLPIEISDLFPDSFEDSELGEIPNGWAGDTFGSFTTAKRGRMITKKDTIEGIIPVVAGGMEPAYYHNQSNVDAPVVTISASGANAGFVNLYFQPIWASDCSYISQTESKFPLTCYLFLKLSQKKIYDAQHGGVQPHINPGDLSRLDFVNATENIFEVFEGIIRPIFAKVSSAIEESKQLENLRDALLPKLISGEIRIPDAEKMLEEVGV